MARSGRAKGNLVETAHVGGSLAELIYRILTQRAVSAGVYQRQLTILPSLAPSSEGSIQISSQVTKVSIGLGYQPIEERFDLPGQVSQRLVIEYHPVGPFPELPVRELGTFTSQGIAKTDTAGFESGQPRGTPGMDHEYEVNFTVHVPVKQKSGVDDNHSAGAGGRSNLATKFLQQVRMDHGIKAITRGPIGEGQLGQALAAEIPRPIEDRATEGPSQPLPERGRLLDHLAPDSIRIHDLRPQSSQDFRGRALAGTDLAR